jgi:hypothetical protein
VSDPDFLRIGNSERDEALKVLGDHFAEGRLPVSEYDERVSKAVQAETRADLKPLFDDLPPPHPAFMASLAPHHYLPPPGPSSSPVQVNRYELVISGERPKVVAGLLQFFLPFGIGRYYLGDNRTATAQLLLALIGIGVIWCMIDGIILLVNGTKEIQNRRPDQGPTAIQ